MINSHNLSRIEAFSDAVFAFAATLLVVSVGIEESNSVLKIDWVAFIGFAISFFVLVGFWWLHYNFFRRTDYMDNWLIALNSILLFVILYYVFPLKSLINSWFGAQRISWEELATLFELYSFGFVLIFLCFSLMYLRAYHKTKTTKKDINLLFYSRHFGIFVLLSLFSVLLAKFQLGVKFGLPGFVYMLLGPLCYFHGVHFNKKIRPEHT